MAGKRSTQRTHPIEKADLATAETVADWRHHPIVRGLGLISELADQPQLYTLCAGVAVVGAIRRDRRMVRTGFRMLAAEWLATKAKSFVKHRIDRTRPEVPVQGGRYKMAKGNSHDSALNSFPSGHTAGAVAVAVAFASEYPERRTEAGLAAAFVAAIQIPRCKHYVSDVSAGAAIGLLAGKCVARSDRRPEAALPLANGGSETLINTHGSQPLVLRT